MMKTRIALGNKGFTLVELLIVVAIIGILASQGVPAYQRMIRKSRTGEAKVLLGNISTAESAMNSEYTTFGNRLTIMGAQMDGNANLHYTGGFIAAAGACTGEAAVFPAAGAAAIATWPAYPVGYATQNAMIGRQVAGGALCTAALPAAFPILATGAAAYRAFAFGNVFILPTAIGGASDGAPAAPAITDVWSIDQNRLLAHVVEGT